FERDNDKLVAAKFEPAVTEPCHREIVEFWWDAINTHKISPPGMTAYGRNEANAIFMAGEAAFTLVDSTHFGEFNDPKRSKIVGKVSMAPFPVGPRAQKPTSWNEIWGWAIPKGVPEERKKLAKEMLSAMMQDDAGQVEMWRKTGGPPPNVKLWPKLAADDKDFAALKHAVFDQTPITHSAYYFAEWPAVHKAYSDMAIAALSGKREDIPKVLAEHVDKIRRAATGNYTRDPSSVGRVAVVARGIVANHGYRAGRSGGAGAPPAAMERAHRVHAGADRAGRARAAFVSGGPDP